MEGNGTKDYIPTLFLSRQEALVHAAAHELRHVWQHMAEHLWDKLPPEETQGKPHPGVGSDYDADRYAIENREWRRLHNLPVYAIAYGVSNLGERNGQSRHKQRAMAKSEITNRPKKSIFNQLFLMVDPNHGN